MLIIVITAVWFCTLMWFNGTMETMDRRAVQILQKNTDIAGGRFESAMTTRWSNIGGLPADVEVQLAEYLRENEMSIEEFMASHEAMAEFDTPLTETMLYALRYLNANGIFIIFSNGEESKIAQGEELILHGLHYRDLEPDVTPTDYSDIIMERGEAFQAQLHGIALDVTWQQEYLLTAANLESFDMYMKPLMAAKANPNLSATDLAYWNVPRVLTIPTGPNPNDPNSFITYTIPLIFDGKVIGVIGSEIQVSSIESGYLNPTDFDILGAGGYALVTYTDADIYTGMHTEGTVYGEEYSLEVMPQLITGDIVTDEIADQIPLPIFRDVYNPWHMASDNIFVFNRDRAHDSDTSHMSLHTLTLYSENSPFKNEHWAVLGVSPNAYLFETTNTLWDDLLISGLVCIGIAIVITLAGVSIILHPVKILVTQIKNSDGVHTLEGGLAFDLAETSIIRHTVNDGIRRTAADSKRITEEQERLALALSLATGTLLEYDAATDTNVITRYDSENFTEPKTWTLEHTLKHIRDDDFIHPEDIRAVTSLFMGETSRITARVKIARLPKDVYEHDSDYVWLKFACKPIRDEQGKVIRIIGTTQDVTEAEYEKQRKILEQRIDPTTHLYNCEYGKQLCVEALKRHKIHGEPSMLVQIQLEPALACERYYGIFYTNILHIAVVRRLIEILPDEAIILRGGDNEVFVLVSGAGDGDPGADFRDLLYRIVDITNNLYSGENRDIVLSLSAGAAISKGDLDLYEMAARTNAAVKYVVENNIGAFMFYAELPSEVKTPLPYKSTPITFTTDIEVMTVTQIAFNLFERTKDINSVISILAKVTARKYGLRRVFVIENNAEVLTSSVTFYYASDGTTEPENMVIRVPKQYYKDFEEYTIEDGIHIVTSNDNPNSNVVNLLRVNDIARYSILACGMYVDGELFGKIVFMHDDPRYEWSDKITADLNETSKLITSHLSRARSDTASKAKTEFLSKISHEIRTPMNAIVGLSDIALKTCGTEDFERTTDCLKKIDSSAKFLLSIINDVLDMSKIESGTVVIENAPFNLRTALEDVAAMITPIIQEQGLQFITEFKLENNNFIGDEPRLKQVLVNLLGNAAKFTEKGRIKFSVTQTGEMVKFAVTDTGIGISGEDIKKIFTSYVQLDSADKVYGGTGLGLPISSNIIKLMGAQIEVESELGQGSSFFFTIKMEPLAEPEIPEPEKSAKDYTGYFAGKRALIVEDNELNTEIAVVILEEAGFEIVTAENGMIGAEEYDKHESGYFDVILMDIRMPVLDGLGSTRMIRNNTTHEDAMTVPIVAMTANAFDDDMKKSLEAGMNGYLPKPIDTEKLYELLDSIIFGDKGR
jgi:signal transduction histidine kinase/GGDEF domain-containing protein